MVEIIDEKTKNEIKAVIDEEMHEFKKTWGKELKEAKKSLDSEIRSKKKTVGKEMKKLEKEWDSKTEEYVESFKENPVEWVAGAFVAGLLLGGLLRK